jgi:NAD dependent epimerase/dehydratase family enzyme
MASNSAPRPAKRVLLSGATGFIGPKLARSLRAHGYRVVAYVRDFAKARRLLGPEVDVVVDLAALPSTERVDAVVNLAGAPIAGAPWTKRRRALLLDSRLSVTHALLALTERLAMKPETWINASAIGYYGARHGDEPVDEQAPPGTQLRRESRSASCVSASCSAATAARCPRMHGPCGSSPAP